MSIASGLQAGFFPSIYRTHAASTDLKTVSGAPKRCACFLSFQNSDEATEATAVFQGPDAVNVTITVPPGGSIQLTGVFSVTGAFGAVAITCVAGWIDDGTVPLN